MRRATTQPYLKWHNGVAYVHWTDPGPHGKPGRSRRESTGQKESVAAQIYFGEWLVARRGGAAAAGKTFTVAELWGVYYERHVKANVVAVGRLDFAWNNLKPHFGTLKLAEVSRAVDDYVAKRRRGATGRRGADSTIRRELASLVAMFNWCASPERELIDKAPFVRLPAQGEPADRWLTHDEIKTLFAMAEEMRREGRYIRSDPDKLSRRERFLWLALETTKRKEAIEQLTWPRVDFETLVIDFDVPGRKKTKKRRGVVPISKTLLPVLRRMYDERDTDAPDQLVIGPGEDPYKLVVRCAARAGVEGVTPHVLRHTAATHMARRGVPLWLIAKILGNTLAMVERVYAKHCPDDLRAGMEMISGGVVEMGK